MTSKRAAGESQLAPGSRSPSPFPVEPGDSELWTEPCTYAGVGLPLPQENRCLGEPDTKDVTRSKVSSCGSYLAQPAASRLPNEEARNNTTAGSGGGHSAQSSGIIAPEI